MSKRRNLLEKMVRAEERHDIEEVIFLTSHMMLNVQEDLASIRKDVSLCVQLLGKHRKRSEAGHVPNGQFDYLPTAEGKVQVEEVR